MLPIDIDGAFGEGGGQLLRTAVALSAITRRPTHIRNIRARRRPPGLAPQHVAAVRAVAALCHADTEGLEPRSSSLGFRPRALCGGNHRIDVGTAGSVMLVLQAMLPVMLATGQSMSATITGGTDVRQAPAADYFGHVLLPLVSRVGARIDFTIMKRGYYPSGGGEVRLAVAPSVLRPLSLDHPGALLEIDGMAHVAGMPLHIAFRMRDAALRALAAVPGGAPRVEACLLPIEAATGQGGAIAVWARSEQSILGASRVAERGVPAETLGAAVGESLASDIASGAGVDTHAADQLLVFLAMAGSGSFTTRAVTAHASTVMSLIERFLPIRFLIRERRGLLHVAVVPSAH
jgi:RNA 3'-terminal phosphate cyclase (ATP)